MPNISKIKVSNTVYDLKDAEARNLIEQNDTNVKNLIEQKDATVRNLIMQTEKQVHTLGSVSDTIVENMEEAVIGGYIDASGIFNPSDAQNYKYFTYFGGKVTTNSSASGRGNAHMAFFDANFDVIPNSGYNWYLPEVPIVPEGTAYICISGRTEYNDDTSIMQTIPLIKAINSIPEVTSFEKRISGKNIVSFDDGVENAPMNFKAMFKPHQDLHGYSKPWGAGEGKNLLNIVTSGTTLNGVTFTINNDSDGNIVSVTVNGTATDTVVRYLTGLSSDWSTGEYILSGCPAGGQSGKYALYMYSGSAYYAGDYGSGATFTGVNNLRPGIVVWAGVTVNNLVFKPMIRRSSETDSTFEPYTNMCSISGYTEMNISQSGRNIIGEVQPTTTINGITFTVNKDDEGKVTSITVNGTATDTVVRYLTGLSSDWSTGEYILSGCPAGGQSGKYALYMYSGSAYYAGDYGSGATFTGVNNLRPGIVVWAGVTVNNLVFKPMIQKTNRTTDVTEYVPYNGNKLNVQFPVAAGTVYGGSLILDETGYCELRDEYAMIDYYRGEVLPSVWVSSLDQYSPNTSPTTGAQVAYKISNPTIYELSVGQSIKTTYGVNNVWTDPQSDLELVYRANANFSVSKISDKSDATEAVYLPTRTNGNITWTPDKNGIISVNGVNSGPSFYDIWYNTTFPEWLEKGKTYYVDFYDKTSQIVIAVGYSRFNDNKWYMLFSTSTPRTFRIPDRDDISGVIIRLAVNQRLHVNEQIDVVIPTPRITEVENDNLPIYWRRYMDQKLTELQQFEREHCVGDSFIFITDVHWESNAKSSPALMSLVQDNTSVKKIINGGDMFTFEKTAQTALDLINDFMNRTKQMYVACGNHEGNFEGSGSTPASRFNADQRYGVITRKSNLYAQTYGKTYFTLKNDNDKIAYVFLDSTEYSTGLAGDQLTWFTDQLSELAPDYNIVIVVHFYFIRDEQDAQSASIFEPIGGVIEDVISELDSSVRDKILAIFTGHLHVDYVSRTAVGGIPIIATTCDAYSQGNARKALGTTNEQAFDVVYIDTNDGNIYLKRIGEGEDRTVAIRE